MYRLTPPRQESDSMLPSGDELAFDDVELPLVAPLMSAGESAGLDWTVIILKIHFYINKHLLNFSSNY